MIRREDEKLVFSFVEKKRGFVEKKCFLQSSEDWERG
jgi:hypothetical protein